jgi:hypothetical protein
MQGLSVLISGVGIAGPALAHELLRANCVDALTSVTGAEELAAEGRGGRARAIAGNKRLRVDRLPPA